MKIEPNFKPCSNCEQDDCCDLDWYRSKISALQALVDEAVIVFEWVQDQTAIVDKRKAEDLIPEIYHKVRNIQVKIQEARRGT